MEADFARFVKERFGVLLTVISSMPLLANYFTLLKIGKEYEKPVVLITTLVCGLIFFVLQSKRYSIAGKQDRNWLVGGLVATLTGTALFLYYLINQSDLTAGMCAVLFILTFLFLLNGSAILLLQIYVNEEERKQFINEIVSTLNHDQWAKFMVYCRAFVKKNEGANQRPNQKKAYQKSRSHIVNLTAEMFIKIERGIFEIRGKEMDNIYKYYMEAVSNSFKASSYNDLDYWMNEEESNEYFASNLSILKRGCSIERIFIVEDKAKVVACSSAIKKQLDAGVKVGILLNRPDLKNQFHTLDLDFGIFDDFAVSSWNFSRGRIFRITQEQEQHQKFKEIFEQLQSMAVVNNGKRYFQNVNEFNHWILN
jgi:hypothetical protein